jgi:glycosyltransferase involved in cell wall biosynthesis
MRFLIDCFHVSFGKVPSGIPRVVLSYIDVGYNWGSNNQIDVIPVVPTADGMFAVRPAPGKKAPEKLKELTALSGYDNFLITLRSLCDYGYVYTKDIVHHGLMLLASIIRFRRIRRLADYIDCLFASTAARPQRMVALKILSRVKVEPEPGDILFAPGFWYDNDPQIYRSLQSRGVRMIGLVHDILPITHPQYYETPARDIHYTSLREAFYHFDAFLCISNCTRSALQEFGIRNGLPIRPVVTVYNGFDGLSGARTVLENGGGGQWRNDLSRLFEPEVKPLIMVGTIEPKKGHIRIIEALEKLWQDGYKRPLVIIGRRGWMYDSIVRKIHTSKFYGSKLNWFSDLSDADLAYAYSRCHALIFASIAEGFGIPMVEASCFRKPTLALRTSIAEEILGNFGVYYGHDSESAFSKALHSLESIDVYEAMVNRLDAFQWPTSEETVPLAYNAMVRFFMTGEFVTPSFLPGEPRLLHCDGDVRRYGSR